MANMILKKAISSMLNVPIEQMDTILNVAETFKNNEIDRKLAIELLNKFSKKTPKEINTFMKFINDNIS